MSRYAVTNPATNEVEEEFPTATDDQIATALDAAQEAYATWSSTQTSEQRAALLANVASIYLERKQELAQIINHEMGKQVDEAIGEVEFSSAIYQYYADNGPDFLADVHIDREAPGSAMLRKEPIGVLLGVMPWNYPYYQVARFAGPNLLLGNTILLKHAAQCPRSSAAMEQIFLDAGFPIGAYTNLYASFDQVGTIIADPRLRGVSLTGSERAGRQIARQAGENLKKVVCELGGNDPFIVLSCDDVQATAQTAAVGKYENAGQVCNGPKRFIVIDSLYDEFLEQFKQASLGISVAPLSSLAAAERLSEQVHSALEQGATLELGSPDNDGCYFQPTILTNIPEGAPMRYEEFFGPVSQFYRVGSEEEAVALANDTPYGLGSYVFTTDAEQGVRVADSLDTGMTYINEIGADSSELPFGGVKNSGFGRELGSLGTGEFVNLKLICSDTSDLF